MLSSLASLDNPTYVKFYPKLIKELSHSLTSDELALLVCNLMDDQFGKKTITRTSFTYALFNAVVSPFSTLKREGKLETIQMAVLQPLFTSFLAAQDAGKYIKDGEKEDFIAVLEEFIEMDLILNATLYTRQPVERMDEQPVLSDEAIAKVEKLYVNWETAFSFKNNANAAVDDLLFGVPSEAGKKAQLAALDKVKQGIEPLRKVISEKNDNKANEAENNINAALIKKLAKKFSLDQLLEIAVLFLKETSKNEKLDSDHFGHALISAILDPHSELLPRNKIKVRSMQKELIGPFYSEYLDKKHNDFYLKNETFQDVLEQRIKLTAELRSNLLQMRFLKKGFQAEWPKISASAFLIDFVEAYQDYLQPLLLLQARVNELDAIWQHCANAFGKNSERAEDYLGINEAINDAFKSVLDDEGELLELIKTANQKITEAVAPHLNASVAGQTTLQRIEKLNLPHLVNRLKSEPGFKAEEIKVPEVRVNRAPSTVPPRAKSLLMNRESPKRKPSAPRDDQAKSQLETRVKELNEIWQIFSDLPRTIPMAKQKFADLKSSLIKSLKDVTDIKAANDKISGIIAPHLNARVNGLKPAERLKDLPPVLKERLEIELGMKKEKLEEVAPVKQEIPDTGLIAKALEVPKSLLYRLSPSARRGSVSVSKEEQVARTSSIPTL